MDIWCIQGLHRREGERDGEREGIHPPTSGGCVAQPHRSGATWRSRTEKREAGRDTRSVRNDLVLLHRLPTVHFPNPRREWHLEEARTLNEWSPETKERKWLIEPDVSILASLPFFCCSKCSNASQGSCCERRVGIINKKSFISGSSQTGSNHPQKQQPGKILFVLLSQVTQYFI